MIKETLCRATELLLFIAYKESEEAFAEGGRNMFELNSSLQLSFLQLELRQLFAGCKHFTGSLLALLQRPRWEWPSQMVCSHWIPLQGLFAVLWASCRELLDQKPGENHFINYLHKSNNYPPTNRRPVSSNQRELPVTQRRFNPPLLKIGWSQSDAVSGFHPISTTIRVSRPSRR